MGREIFDTHSCNFTKCTDEAIAAGAYERGQLFAAAIQNAVAPGEIVLDYGCGPGRIGRMLVERGYMVEGCDPAPNMIRAAQGMGCAPDRARFWVADDNGDSLESGRYGGVACSSVIEFVADPQGLLSNFHRSLKRGGTLALSFSNRLSLWRAFVKWRQGDRQPHYAIQYNSWTFAEARAALEQAGFRVVSGPIYYDVSAFRRRPYLAPLARSAFVGTLGLVTSVRA